MATAAMPLFLGWADDGNRHPDYQGHRRYTVTLRSGNGSVKTVRVLTNRGEAKAAYLQQSPRVG